MHGDENFVVNPRSSALIRAFGDLRSCNLVERAVKNKGALVCVRVNDLHK